MAEFKFYNQSNQGKKDKENPRYESRKMVLNQPSSRLDWKVVEKL